MDQPGGSSARTFPRDFVWGASTSAYQIEGARRADGGGESIWDQFSRKPGKVRQGQTGETACQHYHHYREDVKLFAALGLRAYHFSVSWPRVLPDGTGDINERGLDFYDRLVDALLAENITPWITLFHWDLPSALYARGGWLNPDSAAWFARYAELVVKRLSDRVRHFITLGEPICFIGTGMFKGGHAPGDQHELRDVLQAGHHALLAHGTAVRAMRAAARQPLQIGLKGVSEPRVPVPPELALLGNSDPVYRDADIHAARELTFRVDARPDASSVWFMSWWTDPIYLGAYPERALADYGRAAPRIKAGEMAIIGERLDFFAVNTYKGIWARAGAEGPEDVEFPPGFPTSTYGWPIVPEAAYWGPRFLHERYRLPIVITENGLACRDWVGVDGRVRDSQRIDFLHRYLREAHRAISDGVPIFGYFHWSALDNFEWDEGYNQRFGLIHVDFSTQKRTPKDSAHFYRDVIATQGRSLWPERERRAGPQPGDDVELPALARPALPADDEHRRLPSRDAFRP
jgi:beta-glucosidase